MLIKSIVPFFFSKLLLKIAIVQMFARKIKLKESVGAADNPASNGGQVCIKWRTGLYQMADRFVSNGG
jgi:hypothetical protein